MNIGNQLRSEVRKLFGTKLWLWLLLGAMAFTALITIITIATDGSTDSPNPHLNTAVGMRNLFSSIGAGSVLAIVLGAVGMTGEYRHQTVTPTFLASPHRGRVVVAKLITYLIAGIGYGIACTIVCFAIALPWLSAKDLHIGGQGVPQVVLGAIAAIAIYTALGVGVGALVRNQIAAIVGTLVYLFVLEGILSNIPHVRDYYRWFPGGAAQALAGSSSTNTHLFDQWQGGVLFAAYAFAFALAGRYLAVRRDVT
jgi:ABC-type transport system involved in multi-copper enzyme maturation permease subunit